MGENEGSGTTCIKPCVQGPAILKCIVLRGFTLHFIISSNYFMQESRNNRQLE